MSGEIMDPEFMRNLIYDLHCYQNAVEKEPLITGMIDDDGEEVKWVGTGVGEGEEKIEGTDKEEEEEEEPEEDQLNIKAEKPEGPTMFLPPPVSTLTERSAAILALLSKVVIEKDEEGEEGQDYDDDKRRSVVNKKFKFCPWCSNLLQVHQNLRPKTEGCWRWKCATCPYNRPILKRHRYLTFKEASYEDDEEQIVQSAKANEHRQKTEILCPQCQHKEAYFYQMQTRSADEPMTTFYECCKRGCGHHWRD